MATHILRTQLLGAGASLSEVIERLSAKMNIAHRIVPMTDERVRTQVHCRDQRTLSFQHYFVRDRCQPEVTGFEFSGIDKARPSAGFSAALASPLSAVIICPSNPFVSVAPILEIPGVVAQLQAARVPVVVISNIVGGEAIKGPAAKMMSELGMPQTALGVAQHYVEQYGDLVKGFVLDTADAALEEEVNALGLATIVTKSVMLTLYDKIELAKQTLAFASTLEA
jgi:LPPG:FO 2-phospho-L-lactate transferase